MTKRYLDELLNGVDILADSGNLHVEVSGVFMDSRRVQSGGCFVAIRGFNENGLNYMGDAIARGAASIVFESDPEDTIPDMPAYVSWVQVKNARKVVCKMASVFYPGMAESLDVTGITGTNGKTTIMSLIHAILSRRFKTANIGTLGMTCGDTFEKTGLTTPESIDILRFLNRVREDEGCTHVVMEVSSVALKLHRVNCLNFSQGIFTTFTGDHLDFHHTMEDYLDSKMMLFRKLGMDDWAVINIDDPTGLKILDQVNCKYLTYGFSENADIRPMKYKFTLDGTQAAVRTPRGIIDIKCKLIGRVNLTNILAAVASAVIKRIPEEDIAAALGNFGTVKGRLDPVYNGKFAVLVDFAHTDKALEGLLVSLKEIKANRLILVFGAGGSRDKTKRPRMGQVASLNADYVVVTSDNPRKEEPTAIVEDVVRGFGPDFKQYSVETDRRKAIGKAIRMAQKGDIVVVAGKGHEDYQIFKDKTIHFDDFEEVRNVLEELNLIESKKVKNA
jgi:UDP-N-acetylmuramoyl-L-alanyl-D-glutamate--2,6-diaminopimelate ligase